MKKKIEQQLDLLPGASVVQAPQSSQLDLEQVDDLLILCEEVMRATPEGSKRFIEPAPGVLSRANLSNIILFSEDVDQENQAYYEKLRQT